jgi:hypothetical protein
MEAWKHGSMEVVVLTICQSGAQTLLALSFTILGFLLIDN